MQSVSIITLQLLILSLITCHICSDPSFESDPSNEYSLLRLTHVLNSIFLDPSDEFLTQVVNIGIPKQILGFCFQVSKRGYKIACELTEEDLLEAANALTSYRCMARAGKSIKTDRGGFAGGCQCSDQLPMHGKGWQEYKNWPRCQLTS